MALLKIPSGCLLNTQRCFGNLEPAFLNYGLPKAWDLHFFEGDCDIEDELFI
jgi:hypothetical protein